MKISVIVCAMTWLLAGCNVVERQNSVSYQYQNQPISPSIWNAIVLNQTDTQWLLQYIGEPTRIEKAADKIERYLYQYERLEQRRTRVILFYQQRDQRAFGMQHVVELKNNKVIAHWDIAPTTTQPPAPQVTEPTLDPAARADAPSIMPSTVPPVQPASDTAMNASAQEPSEAVLLPTPLDKDL